MLVRVSVWQNAQAEIKTAREINREAADRIASADLELRRAYARIDGLEGEVNRRATQIRTRVRDLDALGIAHELNRFSVGSAAEGLHP